MTTVVRRADLEVANTDLIVGVDIGGTNSVAGIVDSEGTILAEEQFPTMAQDPAEAYVPRLVNVVNDLRAALPVGSVIQGMIIAIPAANPREGFVESPANFRWGRVDLVSMMKKALDLPVSIINDGDAAVLGEVHYGTARGMKNVLMITLGTGLGAGIVVQGNLVQGGHGAAGEFGHMAIIPGGRQCGCGRRGCAETYISASGLRRTVYEILAHRTEASPLRRISFDDLSAEAVTRHAREGDIIAKEALEATGVHLGQMLANLAAAFDPEAIVLCGGLVKAGDLLVEPARRSFQERLLDRYQGLVQVLVSDLNNGEAAILGASWLAREMLQGAEEA